MKSKSTLWTLLVLGCLGILATPALAADQAAVPEAPEQTAVEASTPAVSTPNCDTSASVFGSTDLSLGDSDQTQLVSNFCGSCSNYPCAGRQRGSWCAPNKWCIPTLTTLCPGNQDWDCSCASYYY
ncbi:MAG: hypothetical protein SX243_25905, partial [Acidobacteriota bacterium]|nr:hypothetical protein [Acidobacteriota bacterium]